MKVLYKRIWVDCEDAETIAEVEVECIEDAIGMLELEKRVDNIEIMGYNYKYCGAETAISEEDGYMLVIYIA